MTATLTPSDQAAPPQPRRGMQLLLVRLHFYAGILIAPFLAVAAITGLLYCLAPQVDQVAYGDLLSTSSTGERLPVSEQVAAAQAVFPDLTVSAIDVATGDKTTRVTFSDPSLTDDRERTAYVDPYTGTVKGSLVTWFGSTPAVTWLDDLHRNLHLGETGRHYSEIAASWLWVVVLGGVVLWVRRRRDQKRLRRMLLPELSARGRKRVISWHGATGLALTFGLLFLSATGLTWSRFAGENFSQFLDRVHATAPSLSTGLPDGEAVSTTTADSDRVLASARSAGLDGPLQLVPASDGGAWSVSQTDDRFPVRKDSVGVDPQTGEITSTNPWSDRPVLSKLSSLGISAHMGVLFGPASQVVLAAIALGLLCVIFWGYRAWWQRRPRTRRVGRAPVRGAWREIHPVTLGVTVLATAAVCWVVPWFGATIVAFLVVDGALGLVARRRATPTPVSEVETDDPAEELLV